jgi:hypothetical protein
LKVTAEGEAIVLQAREIVEKVDDLIKPFKERSKNT